MTRLWTKFDASARSMPPALITICGRFSETLKSNRHAAASILFRLPTRRAWWRRSLRLGSTPTQRGQRNSSDRIAIKWSAGQNSLDYTDYITIEPGTRGGKPCIRGTRITVQDVQEYLVGGMTVQELLGDFPELTVEDIGACLLFAADQPRAA